MIRPVSLYIGLRYTRAKRRSRFVSFISLVSMLGIALGVAALITVLSVMNGFDYQIRQQFFSVSPPVTISTNQDIMKSWPALAKKISTIKGVQGSAPFIMGKGMLTNQGLVSGVATMGILPKEEKNISRISHMMIAGKYDSLIPGSYHMIVGAKLASNLGLMVGDKANLLTPQTSMTPFGVIPRYRQFTITGIFKTNSGFGFDSGVAYINMHDAQKLYASGQIQGGLHLKIQDVYQAQQITNKINNLLPSSYFASNWTQTSGAFFKALAMEKVMMFVLLLLVVAVAAFNLVSTLMMTVNDKRTDIAILRTMGASPRTILSIFIIQGGLVGLIGSLLGVGLGVLLALNATEIVNGIQTLFHVQFISSSVYFINYLPSRLEWSDVINIGILAWVLSLLATIYPAWVASRTQPAEALRYD